MKTEKYFKVHHSYLNDPINGGQHIVCANTSEEAIQIAVKFGITNPWGRTDIKFSTAQEIDIRISMNKQLIDKRRNGFGGKIWYVENDILKFENEEKIKENQHNIWWHYLQPDVKSFLKTKYNTEDILTIYNKEHNQ